MSMLVPCYQDPVEGAVALAEANEVSADDELEEANYDVLISGWCWDVA